MCQQVIAQHAARPAVDRLKFWIRSFLTMWLAMLMPTGKFLVTTVEKPDLAPVYDVLSGRPLSRSIFRWR